MPALTNRPGQLAGLAATCLRPLRQSPTGSGGWAGLPSSSRMVGRPASSGRSRTLSQVNSAISMDSRPSATNTVRQDTSVTSQASGSAALAAPRLPMNMVTPFSVAKRFSGNQAALILSSAMKGKDTPSPTRVRPITATPRLSACANTMEPMPATTPPSATMRRGPSVSASTPVGICITM